MNLISTFMKNFSTSPRPYLKSWHLGVESVAEDLCTRVLFAGNHHMLLEATCADASHELAARLLHCGYEVEEMPGLCVRVTL